MKRIWLEVIATVFFTWLLSLLSSSIYNYFTQSNISVLIGAANFTNDSLVVPIVISNFSKEPINDLDLLVPSYIKISEIGLSSPVLIKKISSDAINANSMLISISNVSPNKITNIFIPIETANDFSLIEVINVKQKNIVMLSNELNQSPVDKAVSKVIGTTTISVVVYGLLFFFVLLKNKDDSDKLMKQIDRADTSIESLRKGLESSEAKVAEAERVFTKVKLILMARISDRNKELAFWRDTIRKILYEQNQDKHSVELLMENVSKSLKTYTTLEKATYEFETIEYLAKIINSKE